MVVCWDVVVVCGGVPGIVLNYFRGRFSAGILIQDP
jgi:hypothetical protein